LILLASAARLERRAATTMSATLVGDAWLRHAGRKTGAGAGRSRSVLELRMNLVCVRAE
jgi:hypothetical protein